MNEVILSVEGLTVRYGGATAVDDVSLEVRAGQLLGVIGPNGAGKTTLIDAITGFVPSVGRITLAGRTFSREPAFRRARAGLARTFQSGDLWDDLSALENVTIGSDGRRWRRSARPNRLTDWERQVVDLLELDGVLDVPVGQLSQGQRNLVSVARALAMRPRVLLLDEPAAGLDSAESVRLAPRLRAVQDLGITILLVDHDVSLIMDVCDFIQVMDFGRIVASDVPDGIRRNSLVIDAYLGASAGAGTTP